MEIGTIAIAVAPPACEKLSINETLASLPEWKNQILIDGTNPFHGKAGNFKPADLGNLG